MIGTKLLFFPASAETLEVPVETDITSKVGERQRFDLTSWTEMLARGSGRRPLAASVGQEHPLSSQ